MSVHLTEESYTDWLAPTNRRWDCADWKDSQMIRRRGLILAGAIHDRSSARVTVIYRGMVAARPLVITPPEKVDEYTLEGAQLVAVSRSIIDSRCEFIRVEEIRRNPVATAGKLFCGDAYLVRDGRTVRLLGSPNEMPPSNDLALLVTIRSRAVLSGLSYTPRQFYVEAILRPQLPCFTTSEGEGECIPFRRPIHVEIIRVHPSH